MNPVTFRGRVIQQVGRIMRTGPDKTGIEVHDYLDAAVPRLERSHHKRRRLLEKHGFTTASTPPPGRSQPVTTQAATPTRSHTKPAQDPEPTAAEVRAWARSVNIQVPQRGRVSTDLWQAYRRANSTHGDQ